MPVSGEVGTVFTIDAALQHVCANLREQAALGEITSAECDLLIDGAILLAVHLEGFVQDAHAAGPLGPTYVDEAGIRVVPAAAAAP
jgi:hypothetical protein